MDLEIVLKKTDPLQGVLKAQNYWKIDIFVKYVVCFPMYTRPRVFADH